MNYKNKIFSALDTKSLTLIEKWKGLGHKVVFTNGCFDILHSGHIKYLAEAADLGDRLIIGLNSDSSVKKLKGENRPVKSQNCRADILAFMSVVDMVIIFDEETPVKLIETILPDVLVKGGDWKPDQIVGSDIVIKNGGTVKSLNFLEGFSTTKIIERII
jgi:rfaE bifunctional protein nucleotidyltransferase chain/domain